MNAIHIVLHELNMTHARLLSAIMNCSAMISTAPDAPALDKARERLAGAMKSIESYEKMVKTAPRSKSITV